MATGPVKRFTKPHQELKPLEIGHCYHCETKAMTNSYCQLWEIWACKDCLQNHHRTHHNDCKVEEHGKKSDKDLKQGPRYFTVSLTRFDGPTVFVTCKLGQKIEMEPHWLGTYVYFPGSMVLVRETSAMINDKILLALQSAA